jgi:putative methionine-R-sulfoxide reductase with GAF domain
MEKAYPVCYVGTMDAGRSTFLSSLEHIATTAHNRQAALEQIAALLRNSANYRWVGLYDIDHAAGLVRNITWSGPGAPEHPTFSLTKGLTSAAVAQKQTINIGDVSADSRYLTAFGTTRSEMIVPVFDGEGKSVLGTIDIERVKECPFAADSVKLVQAVLRIARHLASAAGGAPLSKNLPTSRGPIR